MEGITENFWFQLTASVIVIIGIIVGILMIVQHFRRNPPLEAEFATHEDLAALKAELSATIAADRGLVREDMKTLTKKIEGVEQGLDEHLDNLRLELTQAGAAREENIFRRINAVSDSLQNQITNLPGKIVELLRNTGALKSSR